MLVMEHACILVSVHVHNAKKTMIVVIMKKCNRGYNNEHNTTGTIHIII